MVTPRYPASLVIPVYGDVAYTAACLASIAEHTDPSLYEVVLVDNATDEPSRSLLDSLEGDVRVLRNPTNLGFAKACNQGAAAALGRHLVFVNNDVEAHPGWLEPLLATLDADPRVGVVGARLLFPDGTLQHGGVVTAQLPDPGRPLLAIHHPYHADPSTAAARRELDVVTGALMAVRRSVFEQVHGFHEGYWNGMEDVDLCLQVREAGYRVVYEPASTLTHHESVSGPERFSRVDDNTRLFNRRWAGRYLPEFVADADGRATPNPRRTGDRPFVGRARTPARGRPGGHRRTSPPAARPDPAPTPAPAPVPPTFDVTVVVVLEPDRPDAAPALLALAEHTPCEGYDVVVVDDASVANAALLDSLGGDVAVLRHTEPVGPVAARREGLTAATGRHVVLLDSSTEVGPGWLAGLTDSFAALPRLGAVVVPVRGSATGRPALVALTGAGASALAQRPEPDVAEALRRTGLAVLLDPGVEVGRTTSVVPHPRRTGPDPVVELAVGGRLTEAVAAAGRRLDADPDDLTATAVLHAVVTALEAPDPSGGPR